MSLKLRELSVLEFKAIHDQYLVEDFPLLERKPFYFLKKMYEKGKYTCYVLEDEESMKGYASFVWTNDDVVLLDYFAINSSERGTGIGSKMINMLVEELKDELIIFECESPDTAKDLDERTIRERRISFYEKNGANLSTIQTKMLGVRYKIMYLSKKKRNKNIEDEINLIYDNMFPKFIFGHMISII